MAQSFSINGSGNPRTVKIGVGEPIGPHEFAKDVKKPFTKSTFGVAQTTRASQKFPPRRDLPLGATRELP